MQVIKELIQEIVNESESWRLVDGTMVPFGCPACIQDIEGRIEDACVLRDQISKGSADRQNLNGVLSFLRKMLRKAHKNAHLFDVDL